jgi:hypothetical protein
MKIKTSTFRGLTFDIVVDEAQTVDAQGGRIWYTAAVYLKPKGQQERHLVRKSRLPGVADELAAEIRRDGIRVFDRFSATLTPAATAAARP